MIFLNSSPKEIHHVPSAPPTLNEITPALKKCSPKEIHYVPNAPLALTNSLSRQVFPHSIVHPPKFREGKQMYDT